MPKSKHRKKRKAFRIKKDIDRNSLLVNPRGFTKMSKVLLDFMEPYKVHAKTDEAFRKLVIMSIIAWNVSLLPESERDTQINKFAFGLLGNKKSIVKRVKNKILSNWIGIGERDSEEDEDYLAVTDFKAIIYEMIERKIEFFSGDNRMIADYELDITEDGLHLSVFSVVGEDDIKRIKNNDN